MPFGFDKSQWRLVRASAPPRYGIGAASGRSSGGPGPPVVCSLATAR